MTERISIPPRHVRTALERATGRNEFPESMGWTEDRKNSERDHFVGLLGEVAFSIYADVQYDPEIYPVRDDGCDFVVRLDGEQTSIDIKARRKRPSQLLVEESRIEADLFVLAQVIRPDDSQSLEGWKVDLIGCAWKDELLNAHRQEADFPEKEAYNRSILRKNLHPLPDPGQTEQP